MPKVLSFWQLMEQEEEMFDIAFSGDHVWMCPWKPLGIEEEASFSSLASLVNDPKWEQIDICELESKIEIRYTGIDAATRAIDRMESPVLTYSRGGLIGNQLYRSNLSAYTYTRNREFSKWVDKVFSRLKRKYLPETQQLNGFSYLCTAAAASSVSKSEISLIL